MLEQVVNYFHEMSETNPDFFINDNDFLDVRDVDQMEALMINFYVAIFSILHKKERRSKAYYSFSAGMARQLLPSDP